MVDRFSRWPEAFPLKTITAAACCGAFLRGWISRFGVPDELVTDRGAQFTGSTWKEFISGLGIASSTTTSYHPQANGMVERMHRQLKAALKARLTSNDWMDDLPLVLLGLRSAWREAADTSPAEILYGVSVRLPGQFVPGGEDGADSRDSFATMMFQKMQALRPVPSRHHGSSVSTYLLSSLLQAKTVYVRHDAVHRPLQRPYNGPYNVITAGEIFFKILKNGSPITVSVDRLKPAVSLFEEENSVHKKPCSSLRYCFWSYLKTTCAFLLSCFCF